MHKSLHEAAMETLRYGLDKGAKFDEEQLQICKDNGMEINEVNDEEFRNKLYRFGMNLQT